MSSWWRKYTELLGVTPSGKSWRQQGMKATGLLRDDLAQIGSGGWDRRVVTHFDRLPGPAPWARHLVEGGAPVPVENGVVHNGDPVFHENVRVVHNG